MRLLSAFLPISLVAAKVIFHRKFSRNQGLKAEWKERKGNHNSDFKYSSKRGATCLSGYIWSLKDKGMVENKDFTISWTLVARAKAYSSTTDCCRLCIKEKSLMILQPHLALLNDRDEFFNHCRHKNKLLLSNIK